MAAGLPGILLTARRVQMGEAPKVKVLLVGQAHRVKLASILTEAITTEAHQA